MHKIIGLVIYKLNWIEYKHQLCVLGKSNKRHGGRPTVLSKEEENEIVITCQVLQEMGFGMTREMVATVIMEYIRDKGLQSPFTNDKPGNDGIHLKVARA